MEIEALDIPEVRILKPRKFGDHRGFFSETYNKNALAEAGIHLDFVQDNHSLSATPGTLRGLHFQTPPMAQDKLVRVVRGAVWDVAVDIRAGSPTYGRWVGAEISAAAWNQILVPAGFAHGFLTLTPDTEVEYKVTAFYAPDCDKGLAWDDPDLAIDWPLPAGLDRPVLSEKDARQPRLRDGPAWFTAG
ncbi:dTDP-4-dehydrorhamnose 3,5-epimerase [Roseospira navarrensis]|uniref:dTDP-4-dehydrorhamnose 3,5-epimerase n=1 Tax=Roseospira navarrensis TaxID=140058 RepID=A0A7X2D5J5_9PROT|nr:dTDP-4-dehydrorhamnose 3,5-epimerase [Roseospira navarrensis]MQX37747.1 dTDP-4-dehydrorhamnose 3,5-epimerase [Roseospira navarrensis]